MRKGDGDRERKGASPGMGEGRRHAVSAMTATWRRRRGGYRAGALVLPSDPDGSISAD